MKKILRDHRTLLAVAALCLVGAGWWGAQQRGRTSTTPAGAATAGPADVLAAIPRQMGSGASDLAVVKWTAQARENGGDARTWVHLGDALMQKARETADTANYGYAEGAYRKALTLNPQNDDAMTGLAWVNGERRQFDKSIDWANKAVALNGRNNLAYGLLGDADVEQGNYDAAFEHYQKMLDLRPDISSYSRGAHLLLITGQTFRAGWMMRKAIASGAAFAENTGWCRAQLALIYFSDGNLEASEQVLKDALKKLPNNRYALAEMGKVKAARKDYPAAIGFYKKAIAMTPEHESLVALGDLYALTGDKAEAEKQYALVEEMHRKNHAADATDDFLMAQFYADHDRNLVEALRLAEQRKTTKNVFEADILAWCYYKNNQPQQAKAAITRALSRRTPDAKILYHAGMIYAAAGDPTAAQRYLYQALSLNPNFSPVFAPSATDTLKMLSRKTAARASLLPPATSQKRRL
jgi:tetratricopeptide (TPR) repeat protein